MNNLANLLDPAKTCTAAGAQGLLGVLVGNNQVNNFSWSSAWGQGIAPDPARVWVPFRVQMAEWYRASASGSVDLGFDSEWGQTNDLKIGIHSFPA